MPSFAVPTLPGLARALLEDDGKPVILLDGEVAQSGAYARFLMAHECCHHERGHLVRLDEQRKKRALAWKHGASHGDGAAQSALNSLSFAMSLSRMELDADCCAAGLLARRGDGEGIAAAIAAMDAFGAARTGPYYPSGTQRALTIRSCAIRR